MILVKDDTQCNATVKGANDHVKYTTIWNVVIWSGISQGIATTALLLDSDTLVHTQCISVLLVKVQNTPRIPFQTLSLARVVVILEYLQSNVVVVSRPDLGHDFVVLN